MNKRVGSLLRAAVLLALTSCGADEAPAASQPLDSLPAPDSSVAEAEPSSTPAPETTAAPQPGTTPADEEGGALRVELERLQIAGLLPVDAGLDPMGEGAPPDFVLESQRWMTDCCWLSLTVQDERPLHPDDQLVETIRSGDLEWTLYDSGDEGYLQIAVTTVNGLSISIASQQRYEGHESTPAASQMIRAMVENLEVRAR